MAINNELAELLKDLFSSNGYTGFSASKNLDKLYKFEYEEFLPLIIESNVFNNPYEICKLVENIFREWITVSNKPWIKEKYIVAVMGRYSSGKSSIINSILGEKLLPVDVTPTTAISTYISRGSKLTIKAVDNEGNVKSIRTEVFKQLTKDSVKEIPISKLIKHFIVEYKNDLLKDKSVLDTPGYDSLDEFDKDRALEVINECHHIFWTVDINDGDISRDAINFITEHLSEKPLSIIINKADTKSISEQNKIKDKVMKSLDKKSIKYTDCIIFSSRSSSLSKDFQDLFNLTQEFDNEDYKNKILELIDIIIERTNEQVIEHRKDLSDIDKIKDEAENNKTTLSNTISNKLDMLLEKVFGCTRDGVWGGKVVDTDKWKYFVNKIYESVNFAANKNFELGYEEKRVEWLKSISEESTITISEIEEVRRKAHSLKSKANQLFEEF